MDWPATYVVERKEHHTIKFVGFDGLTATLDLDPTDCLVLDDALAFSLAHDASPDHALTNALRAALEACAVIAATDTLRDNGVKEREMLADTRRVWGAFDTQNSGLPRMTGRPR
ncbi:MAG TPA: hypothetical protein VIL85_21715 [Thermomicrobiales bacterium]|jgi:hypothetical protein